MQTATRGLLCISICIFGFAKESSTKSKIMCIPVSFLCSETLFHQGPQHVETAIQDSLLDTLKISVSAIVIIHDHKPIELTMLALLQSFIRKLLSHLILLKIRNLLM